ncbi:T9SS C-terminal target domain-containing protein [candidate division KSB1 bacterium]|nr:MAG: T9SS C-terminal target domain-containing protein [candidate division KSB1 bacterium]
MKKLLWVLSFILLYAVSLSAVDLKYSAAHAEQVGERAVRLEATDGPNAEPDEIRTTAVPAAGLPGVKIGETAYNYQTNDNLHDRIWYDATSKTIHAQWMYGDIAEVPGFPGRRMQYNFWDGASWLHGLGIPIETQRAGYGSLAVDKNNIAVPTSHHTITNEEATRVYYDFAAGFGFFSMSEVWNARQDGTKDLEPFWPDVATDGSDVWYVTATNNNQDDWVRLINGVNDNIMFWRSTDRGATWSDWIAMFPDTAKYRLTTGASGANEAGSHQVEASDTDNDKVGVLVANPGHDFYFFESDDRGVTFKDGVQILNAPFPEADDYLTYPIRWDVIVTLDSTTMAPADTSLYPFTREETSDSLIVGEPGYHPAPHGPADLLYHKGEAHVVWNETIWTSESTYYPNGTSLTWITPYITFLNGENSHSEGGFSIKHWSPSTGISTIFKRDQTTGVWPGTFQQYVTMPQIGVDAAGNLYCLFTKYSDTDTLVAADGITQAEIDFGPLSFGRIWGAKSADGGKTWGDAVQLIPEDDCIHQNLRYISVANKNGNDAIHIIYQNTPDVPGVPIGEGSDHGTWANAEIRHWAIPVSAFPTAKTTLWGPDIELVTETTQGGLDFGDIGETGPVSKTLTVKNVGDQDLVVTNAFAGDADFTVSPSTFTVPANSSTQVSIIFDPSAKETKVYDTYIALPNNDPNEFSVGIPVTGTGKENPSLVETPDARPTEYSLSQNYPNPFNPATSVQFNIVKDGHVKLAVYNTLGKEIAVLVDKNMPAGSHTVKWQAEDLSSGVYFYRMTAGDYSATKKMILMQ